MRNDPLEIVVQQVLDQLVELRGFLGTKFERIETRFDRVEIRLDVLEREFAQRRRKKRD